jgi:2-oxoglutarate ferredoxin oxidoreductase subunit alpha
MPTRTQQADVLECAYASHGDTKHILLFPSNPAECFEFAPHAFDLAERFQTPVIMLSDLDIGMNDWVVPRLQWNESYRPDRGRVLNCEELQSITTFQRFMPENGTAVAARTLPGVHPKGAYFTRGSGHNKFGGYTEIPDEYQEVVDRLLLKHQSAAQKVPEPVIESRSDARFAVITAGGCDLAVREALGLLDDDGVPASYMRIRGFPFSEKVTNFIERHEHCYVVEQSRDGQLRTLILNETSVAKEKLRSIRDYSGFPLSALQVIKGIRSCMEAKVAVYL